MTERQLQDKVRLILGADRSSIWWENPVGFDHEKNCHYGLQKGSADVIGCFRGRFVGVEMKTPIGRQSSDQKKWEEALTTRAGGLYYLVRSEDDARAVLADLHRKFPA